METILERKMIQMIHEDDVGLLYSVFVNKFDLRLLWLTFKEKNATHNLTVSNG